MIRVTWRQSWYAKGNKSVSRFKSMRAFEQWRKQPTFLNIEVLSIEKAEGE
ncbi:hypothetical protein F373_gp095 [Bacillus phage SP-10]|uniref:hypothetical protein n=1 Tax=Bacillus phage SP10 TaxID=941058 RepID=UPI0002198B33|nr:hypothetical protein F373_gp095 [Bacillus phage SP-10]BAK52907.1 hypothetical protein [Bacillus phage SP-10]